MMATNRTQHSMSDAEIDLCLNKSYGDVVVLSGVEHFVRCLKPLRLGPIWDLTQKERKIYDNAKAKEKAAK